MSEYDYQCPVFLDITEEFMAEGEAWMQLPDVSLSLLSNFRLADTIACVDLMDERMDRGLLHVSHMSLPQYRLFASTELLAALPIAQAHPSSVAILSFITALQSRHLAWIKGSPFADTLLTCAIMNRPEALEASLPRYLALSVLRSCDSLANIVMLAHVAAGPDEFHPHMHGTIDNRRDPTLPLLQTWLDSTLPSLGQEIYSVEVQRLSLWMQLLAQIESFSLNYSKILAIVKDLLALPFPQPSLISQEEEKRQFLIEPLLANIFTTGCIKKPVIIPSYSESYSDFHAMLEQFAFFINLIISLQSVQLDYMQFVSFVDLLFAIDLPFASILRSFIFSLLFSKQLLFGTISKTQLAGHLKMHPENGQSLFRTIEIACHHPTKQRSLIAGMLITVGDVFIELRPLFCHLAQRYVKLGSILDLYTPQEESEALLYIRPAS